MVLQRAVPLTGRSHSHKLWWSQWPGRASSSRLPLALPDCPLGFRPGFLGRHHQETRDRGPGPTVDQAMLLATHYLELVACPTCSAAAINSLLVSKGNLGGVYLLKRRHFLMLSLIYSMLQRGCPHGPLRCLETGRRKARGPL